MVESIQGEPTPPKAIRTASGGSLGFGQAVEADHRGPDRLRILAEVDKGRATGGMVKEILRRKPACSILAKFS